MTGEKSKTIKAECPKCGPDTNCNVLAKEIETWKDGPVSGSESFFILRCAGCDTHVFRKEVSFSEWDHVDFNEWGEQVYVSGAKVEHWPPFAARKRPEWLDNIQDRSLSNILDETYKALDIDARVLAAIGLRTTFDRAAELVGVDPQGRFRDKLNRLVEVGKIGSDERTLLETLIDAGSAAAHRGWQPSTSELDTIVDLMEAFVYRTFVLRDQVETLKKAVPKRES